ncbi:MAG: SGNH/GDSL hydrolase family protein [Myxococcota bacterium]|nr:SGNH/GDSL hydrolase family protein [Myxococcota bacterium]
MARRKLSILSGAASRSFGAPTSASSGAQSALLMDASGSRPAGLRGVRGRLGRIVLSALALGLLVAPSGANAQTERILLVGDSWLSQSCDDGVFDTALANKGFFQQSSVCAATTIPGSTAAQWASTNLGLITTELTSNPTVDIVHLSMGGNDAAIYAGQGQTPEQYVPIILADIQIVVDHILSIRPSARISIWPYDYTLVSNNLGIGYLAQELINLAALTPGFFVLNTAGVLHHTFGFPLGSPAFNPGDTPLPGSYPNYAPLLGGDPNQQADPVTFRDAVHPTEASYIALAEFGIDEFYASWIDAVCGNGIDDDGDGDIDYPDDAECTSLGDGSELADCQDGLDNDGDGDFDYPDDAGCSSPSDLTEVLDCSDGIDNDGDGYTDYGVGNDYGCSSLSDDSELDPANQCDDGIDNDGDGFFDADDPPCAVHGLGLQIEDPACQDGVDNDGDGFIDFDGAAMLNGGVPLAMADPHCSGPWRNTEVAQGGTSCGLGAELGLLIPMLMFFRRKFAL